MRPILTRDRLPLETIVGAVGMLFATTVAAGQSTAQADTRISAPIRLLGFDGRWVQGSLISADAEQWRIVTAETPSERTIARGDIVAFLTDRPRSVSDGSTGSSGGMAKQQSTMAPEPISYGLLETTNGQRLPGNFRQGADANFWDHRWIGSIPIPIDQVATMRLRGARTPERRPDGDTLLLMNGDAVSGFLDKLGNDIEFEQLSTDGAAPEKRRVPIDRVAAISLARSEPAPMGSARFWALDGSVVDGTDLRFDGETGWGFILEDPLLAKVRAERTSDNNAANPLAGLLAPAALMPLASLAKPAVAVPVGEFHIGIADAVRVGASERSLLGLANIELAGPVIATIALPKSGFVAGAAVLSCEVALAEPAPRDAAVDVEFGCGTASSGRIRLDAAHRRAPITLVLGDGSASSIEILVTDGGNGIIGDSIVLERACIVSRRR